MVPAGQRWHLSSYTGAISSYETKPLSKSRPRQLFDDLEFAVGESFVWRQGEFTRPMRFEQTWFPSNKSHSLSTDLVFPIGVCEDKNEDGWHRVNEKGRILFDNIVQLILFHISWTSLSIGGCNNVVSPI